MADILVVDDEEQMRRLLNRTLSRENHHCDLAANGTEARNFLAEKAYDLALCDVNMNGESGIDLARDIGNQYPDTAVIVVTAADDSKTADAAIDSGTYGYILKPFNANELIINVRNILQLRKMEIANRMYRHDLEQMVEERTGKLKRALDGIIKAMTRTVEARDPYTAGHQSRVADLAVAIATEMGLTKRQIEGIMMAGMIHDLGKISVPAELLSKPSRLTDIEFALIKQHSRSGYDIVVDIEFPWAIAQMVLQHHEKLDGSGYPQGLRGEDILIEARILCVADVVEAMASHRPYRPALGIEAALGEIGKNCGILYDADAVKACQAVFTNGLFSFAEGETRTGAR